MVKNMDIVGYVNFGGRMLHVYSDLDEPLFMATQIAQLIDYSNGNTSHMVEKFCEEDEKLLVQIVRSGQRRSTWFVTEMGLYNILSQSRKPIARSWRRVVHDELIRLRKNKGMDVIQQLEEWQHAMDDIYFDPDTGILMQSVTVQGGDVEQIPYTI